MSLKHRKNIDGNNQGSSTPRESSYLQTGPICVWDLKCNILDKFLKPSKMTPYPYKVLGIFRHMREVPVTAVPHRRNVLEGEREIIGQQEEERYPKEHIETHLIQMRKI